MNLDERRYYEAQLDMFLAEGWLHFCKQVQDMKQAADRLRDVTPESLRYRQGELAMMEWVLTWPEQLRLAYEELDKAGAEAPAEAT